MPAPEWIETPQGDLINVAQINFLKVVNNALIITLINGTTRNYSYDTAILANAAFAIYSTDLGATVITPPAAPGIPTVTLFTNNGDGTADLAWSVPAGTDPIQDFVFEYGTTNGGPYTVWQFFSPVTFTAHIIGFEIATTYYYRVTSRNSDSNVTNGVQGTFVA